MSAVVTAVHMAPMKIYHVLLAALPLPFLGFVLALISLQHDRAVLLIKHLPTAEVEASIASAGIGAVVSLMAALLLAAAIAVFLDRFDGEADDTPEYGLAA
jgi:hypothetical protein